jgi:hypothetical protein
LNRVHLARLRLRLARFRLAALGSAWRLGHCRRSIPSSEAARCIHNFIHSTGGGWHPRQGRRVARAVARITTHTAPQTPHGKNRDDPASGINLKSISGPRKPAELFRLPRYRPAQNRPLAVPLRQRHCTPNGVRKPEHWP